jgi:tetratricopeptide (TPR) repeat protein
MFSGPPSNLCGLAKGLHASVAIATTNLPESNHTINWNLSREAVLLLSALVLVILFVFTGLMARFYHQTERSLARQWSINGDAATQRGDLKEAVDDYRTALIYSRSNGETSSANDVYELHLAEALADSGHVEEARSYFLSLAEKQPGAAPVNLELARLAARQNNVSDAARYYNAAIFGVWEGDPASQRRAARIEFAKFLLQHGQPTEAQAQLIALASALPAASRADAPLHVQAGQLLLEAGVQSQAFSEFRRALLLDRNSLDALRGAGMAAYSLSDYRDAANYLERASRQSQLGAGEKQFLETSRAVVAHDPFAAGLSTIEQARRTAEDFSIALNKAQACATSLGATASQNLQQAIASAQGQKPQASETYLRQHADMVPAIMELAFSLEDAAMQCGPLTGDDLALQLLGRSRAGAPQ